MYLEQQITILCCDTEDWSNGCCKFSCQRKNKCYLLTVILNSNNNISQYCNFY